jgi:hypothetical protein
VAIAHRPRASARPGAPQVAIDAVMPPVGLYGGIEKFMTARLFVWLLIFF